MKKTIRLTESELTEIISKVIQEQGGIMISRVPTSPRINLGKNISKSTRLGMPEDNPFNFEVSCVLEPIERIEELFKYARTYTKTSMDDKFAEQIVPKIVKELTGMGSGNMMSIFQQINSEGKLRAVIDNFDKNKSNYSNQSFFEWIENEFLLKTNEIIKILSKYFNLPVCREGCDCPYV
jgi:hypothetical protein